MSNADNPSIIIGVPRIPRWIRKQIGCMKIITLGERTHLYLLPPSTYRIQCLAHDGTLWTVLNAGSVLCDEDGYPMHQNYSTDWYTVTITSEGIKIKWVLPTIWK